MSTHIYYGYLICTIFRPGIFESVQLPGTVWLFLDRLPVYFLIDAFMERLGFEKLKDRNE